MLANLLHRMGVDMGVSRNEKRESVLFLRVNEFVLKACRSTWDSPESVLRVMAASRDRPELLDPILEKVVAPLQRTFAAKFPAYSGGERPLWGIKDPRICLLVPLYRRLLPNARYLVIERETESIAASLHSRFRAKLRLGQLDSGARVTATLEGARRLAEVYQEAVRTAEVVPILQLKYEDCLDDPVGTVERVAEAVGVVDVNCCELGGLLDRRLAFS